MQNEMDKSTINILLIGDYQEIQWFLVKAHSSSHKHTYKKISFNCHKFDGKFVVFPRYEANIAHYDDLARLRNRREYYLKELYCIDVIIYLRPSSNQKQFWEEIRDPDKCIAIDFESRKCKPLSNIYATEQFRQSSIRFFKDTKSKPLLIWMSKQDEKSELAMLPQELLGFLGYMLRELEEGHISNSIYQSIPEKKSYCSIQ